MKRKLLFFTAAFIIALSVSASAQDDDFCDAVRTILRDAPNQFRNTRTTITQTSASSAVYKAGVIVPGTISSRFVAAGGIFYEGALAQAKTVAGVKDAYEKYKLKLKDCLSPAGYRMVLLDNFYEGLSEYKKVAYMPPKKIFTDTTAPANVKGSKAAGPAKKPTFDLKQLKGHVTLELDYEKTSKIYTLVLYVYEH